MQSIHVPSHYDYVGVYLTNKCHLKCPYCITRHHGASFGHHHYASLKPEEWVQGLNRFILPKDVPITLQGGEPFLYKGIWTVLEGVHHKMDIMTALPPHLNKNDFKQLKTLAWNKRPAPYPTIRVSYHKGQNNYKELIERIAELQDLISIGLYYLNHPETTDTEIKEIKEYAKRFHVELRLKEFLGEHGGQKNGPLKYPDAAQGTKKGIAVLCQNTVVPIAPDGMIFLCHSDLYFNRQSAALGNILDKEFVFPKSHLPCDNYGLCNECDIKIKTNHYQQQGYTSVDIKLPDQVICPQKS